MAREGSQAASPENECRRTSPPSPRVRPSTLGRITAPGRTAFVKDGLARRGCPDPGEACRERAYLVTGDGVILGERRDAYVCATCRAEADGMGRTGWLPANAVAVEPPAPVAPESWLGTWTRAEAQIRVARGGLHLGEIEGIVTPQGDSASFGMGEDGPLPIERADAADCQVRLRRLGPWLVVDDNLACGGLNVTFRGVYRRGP